MCIRDRDSELFCLELGAPDRLSAELVKKQFILKGNEIYQLLIKDVYKRQPAHRREPADVQGTELLRQCHAQVLAGALHSLLFLGGCDILADDGQCKMCIRDRSKAEGI